MPEKYSRVAHICKRCGVDFLTHPCRRPQFCSAACRYAHPPSSSGRPRGDRRPLRDRLLARIEVVGECWLWRGKLGRTGTYGTITVPGEGDPETGRIRIAELSTHRASYEVFVGPIPAGLWVLHNCPGGDNPLCINPAHLFLGSHQDNMRDMREKGRSLPGERNPNARLTAAEVTEIRRLYAAGGVGELYLAERYGCSLSNVSKILLRKCWKHIP